MNIAWFNGELLPLRGIAIDPTDRGFLLGDGFFETMAAQDGRVIRFSQHMARLDKTAKALKLTLPYAQSELTEAIHDVLTGCQLLSKRASLRLTVTRGSGPRGLLPPLEARPQVLITASEAPDHFPAAKVKTVSVRRNEQSPASRIKSLCYLDGIFAFEEAHEQGADEALLLNTAGNIAEGSISNIFFIKGDKLYTPKIEDGALPGVMRDCIIELASSVGLEAIEQTLPPSFVQECDEAFLTNSLVRIRPIHELDGRILPSQTKAQNLLEAIKKSEAVN